MENPEQKYLDIVTNNPAAFDSWTYLLQLIEQKNDIDQIRKIYDLFLVEYPYCYVYWEKYASFENNFGNLDKALAIYEKAIQEVRYSVDIWIYYISFLIQQNIQEDIIRRVFEEGCEVVGLDYSSGGFWEKYIEYETSKGNNGKVNELLARVIRIPVQGLTSFYDKFFNRVFERPLTEFLENGKIMEGLDLELNKPPEQLKQEFLNKLQDLFKTSQKTMEEMKKYEDLISTRYYYHFKEQSQDHLLNWHAYLDYVLSLEDHPRIVSTFERCLIACANYEEYFVRYSDYLEKVNKIEGAQKVLKRAVNVFFKNKPSILLHYASFCEQYQLDDVSLLYKNLFKHERNNLHLESILHHINYQKRKGNLNLVKHIYSSSLQLFKTFGNTSTTTTEENNNNNNNSTNGKKEVNSNNFGEEINFLVIHYSNFLIKNCNSPNDSKKLFEEYLPFSSSLSLFLTFLSLLSCFSENEEDYNRILKEVYESDIFRNNSLSDTDKMKFHYNFLNYVRDYSNDIVFFRSVEKDFREFYPTFRSNSIINTKKRLIDDGNLQQKKLKFEPK